jgi:hypothetical protein
MRKFEKLILKLFAGTSDNNFDFKEIVSLLERVRFFTEGKRKPPHIF